MLFGVACGADAEVCVRGLEFADELDGVVVVAVVAALLDEFRGQVAAERHHVLDACRLHFFDALVYRILAAGNTGEMGEHRDVELFLEVLRDIERVVAYAAASAVGDAHECGAECRDGFGGRLHVFEAGFLLGREHFKGQAHLVLLQDVDNLHVDLAGLKFLDRTGGPGLCKYVDTCINIDKSQGGGNGKSFFREGFE